MFARAAGSTNSLSPGRWFDGVTIVGRAASSRFLCAEKPLQQLAWPLPDKELLGAVISTRLVELDQTAVSAVVAVHPEPVNAAQPYEVRDTRGPLVGGPADNCLIDLGGVGLGIN